jgi:general secretion pathway protein A
MDFLRGKNEAERPWRPSAGGFFSSSAHRQALAAIGRGFVPGSGIVLLVTGEAGSGKSMLAAHLRASLDRRRIAVAELGPDGEFPEDHAAGQAREAETVGRGLLLVDRAEAIPPARLSLIAERARESRTRWLLLLLARPGLDRVLSKWPLGRAEELVHHRLAPICSGEVRPYLEHRLAMLGWNGGPALSEPLCTAIFAVSGGNPRAMDWLVSRLIGRHTADQVTARGAARLAGALSNRLAGQDNGHDCRRTRRLTNGEWGVPAIDP